MLYISGAENMKFTKPSAVKAKDETGFRGWNLTQYSLL